MPAIYRVSPINAKAPLNRGLLRWWLCLPKKHGGLVWRELTRKSNAAITGAVATNARTRPRGSGCYLFDGTNDFGQTPTMDFSGVSKMTLSFWLNWDGYTANNDFLMESSTSSSTSSNIGAIQINPNESTMVGFYVRVRVTTGALGPTTVSSITFPRPTAGAWHYYTICFDRDAGAQQVTAVYVDGMSQTLTQQETGTVATGGFGNWAWYLMSRAGSSLFGAGQMDDLRIHNRTPSAAEALSFYRASKGGYRNELRRVRSSRLAWAADAAPPDPAPAVSGVHYYRRRRSTGMAAITNSGVEISSLDTAKPLASIPGNAQRARVVARTQAIHYREDAGTPTATVGTPLAAGSYADIMGWDNLQGFRAIEDAASATLYVEYFNSVE